MRLFAIGVDNDQVFHVLVCSGEMLASLCERPVIIAAIQHLAITGAGLEALDCRADLAFDQRGEGLVGIERGS